MVHRRITARRQAECTMWGKIWIMCDRLSKQDWTILSRNQNVECMAIFVCRISYMLDKSMILKRLYEFSSVTVSNEIQFTHNEKLECMVSGENKKIRLCVIYRPPPSRTNNFRNSCVFRWMVRFSYMMYTVSIWFQFRYHALVNWWP
jgi:hypothetical protein